jgi:hypothetical protein
MRFPTILSHYDSHEGERKMNDKKSRVASSMPRGFEKQIVDDGWKPTGRRGVAICSLGRGVLRSKSICGKDKVRRECKATWRSEQIISWRWGARTAGGTLPTSTLMSQTTLRLHLMG